MRQFRLTVPLLSLLEKKSKKRGQKYHKEKRGARVKSNRAARIKNNGIHKFVDSIITLFALLRRRF